ncbi:MAG TPA: autotransporter outer membrane beta-barrel domain-containing protein, partial [Thermoanaerobaculia bacterium]|nr:autotransporter outer membrane beta-barrel domain-containing protein [Thermoanaerobaculia bacterium]
GFIAVFTLGAATGFADRATGPVAVPIARTLDTICARNENTFAGACSALAALPDSELTPTLERVAPQNSGAQSKVATEVIAAVTGGIAARLTAVRTGVQRLSFADLSLDYHGRSIPLGALWTAAASAAAFRHVDESGDYVAAVQTDAGGSDDNDYNGWSAFLSGNLGDGERKTHPGELGFDLSSRGLMAGIDRLFGQTIVGASINWMQLESDLTQNAGSVDVDGYALSVYASRGGIFARNTGDTGKGMRYDGMHLDGSITLGRNSYDSEHVVEITGLPTSIATSENDADVLALAGVTGFEAHRGRTDFDFALSGTWSRAEIDDLTEEGSGPLILFVQGQEIESLTGTAALSVKSAIPVSFGTLLPNFRAELIHEFKSGARLVTARFLRDQLGTSFTIPLDQPDANYGKIAAGLQASFAHGVSAYIEATQDVLRSDLKFRTIQFIVTKSF